MYLTGKIGSTVIGEAFTVDYDLPSDTAYAETCASVGLMFFAEQMLENEIKGEYADIMKRAFYNTVLAGMQLDGKRFFYVNPLEINIGISQKACTQTHVLPLRPSWYACACCPPNVVRLISSIGKYAYGEKITLTTTIPAFYSLTNKGTALVPLHKSLYSSCFSIEAVTADLPYSHFLLPENTDYFLLPYNIS